MASCDLLRRIILHMLLLTLVVCVARGFHAGNEIKDALNNKSGPRDSWNLTRRAVTGLGGVGGGSSTSSISLSSFTNRESCGSMFMFRCDNGQCVSKHFLCDGADDCHDKSDEKDCQQGQGTGKCSTRQFQCKSGECIALLWWCDGESDCNDNSDEEGCEITCPSDQFKCSSGKCIVNNAVCDGDLDCEHGDDEADCEKAYCLSVPGHYQCRSGECVPPSKVCDNATDCLDGTDEGKACATTCGNDNCTQNCYRTPKGPQCSCNKGFYLERDQVTCSDVDECAWHQELVCDHFCKNTAGGFQCSCHDKYILQEDNVTCKHKQAGSAFLLVAQEDGIRQLYLDGSRNIQITYSKNATTVGLSYDPVTRFVFWSSFGKVFKSPLVPNAVSQKILRDGIIVAEGLAVDWTARNLYLTDPRLNHILVCSLDGSACHELLNGLGHPRAIQVDMANRYMYWSDVKDGTIRKAGMDGSAHDVVVMDELVWPNALALDLPAGRLYWLDANTDQALTVKLDGTDRKALHLAVVHHPFSMALWEDHLYWTDWTHKKVVSCIKRDGKPAQTMLKGSRKNQFFGLSLYHPAMMEDIANPCRYAECSHLCLLSPLTPGYTCVCPTGIMKLDQNNRTCVDLLDRVHLIVNGFKKMYLVSPHKFGRSDQHTLVPELNIQDISDVEYFPDQDSVLVSDQWYSKVYVINMKSGRVTILMEHTVVRSMALDWLRNNLYWLSSDQNVLVVKLKVDVATYRNTIIADLPAPLAIAVAPLLGYLFVSGASIEPHSPAYIKQCGLDGSQCTTLVSTGITRPILLTMDHTHNHLYWGDSKLKTVERINLENSNRLAVIGSHTSHVSWKPVMSVVVTGDRLYFTMERTLNIYTITTNTSNIDFQIIKLDLDPQEGELLRLTRVKWKLPKENQGRRRPCYNNGGCSEICAGNAHQDEVCICGFSSQLGKDGKTCKKKGCADHMFQCVSSSYCIPLKWRCDGAKECSDGSDEAGCEYECPPNHYQCNTTDGCVHKSKLCDGHADCDDGSDEIYPCPQVPTSSCHGHVCDGTKCLLKILVCDGHPNCMDASDEENCNFTCSPDHVQCRSGRCIPDVWACDGDKDCLDGSDEENCTASCPTDHLSCDGKKCISNSAICDGKPDCEDGSDELEDVCRTPTVQTCPAGQVACMLDNPKAELVCIHQNKLCNGVVDCPLGEDENFRSCPVCRMNQFLCPSTNSCIPSSFTCDGEEDCDDAADEGAAANCTIVTTTTWTPSTIEGAGHCGEDFTCEDGTCLPYSKVCDEFRDCPDGSDEQQSCEYLCHAKRCEQKCMVTPSKAFCYCSQGYHLAPDGRSCLDDNECKNEGQCSQTCEERPGGFRCTCLPGYDLTDLTTCKRKDGEEWLVVTWEEGILNITHFYQNDDVSVIPELADVASSTVDPVTGSILYSDGKRDVVAMITKSPEGKMKETVLWRRSNPGPVCYDPRRRNLYVVEVFKKTTKTREIRNIGGNWNKNSAEDVGLWSTIMACNLDDKGCGLIYGSNNSVVQSVAVALREERLFFCTKFWALERGLIMTSFLDGTGMREIGKKVIWCGSVAVDEAKRRVYWTDLALNTVESVTWEGEGHRHVHRQQNLVWYPVGLAVVGPNIVWANTGVRMLYLCPKLHFKGECSQIVLPFVPRGLFAAPMSLAPEKDQCSNVSCSQMCASGGSCNLCRINYQRSSTDPMRCEKLDTCDKNHCEGGSKCEAHTGDKYVCRCPDGRHGLRCELSLPSTLSSATSVNATVVVVVVLVILLVVVLGCIYWWKRYPFTIWKSRGRGAADQGYHFVNPAFGVMHDQPIIEAEDSPRSSMLAQRVYYRPAPYATSPPSAPMLQDQEEQQQTMNDRHNKEESQINTSEDSAVASTTDSLLAQPSTQHSEVNLATPFLQHGANMEDEKDLTEFNFSPFNPSKV